MPDDVVGSELVSRTVSAAGLPAKLLFEMPSNDGFAMRIVVEVAWNLNGKQPQDFYRIVVRIQRQLLQIVPNKDMLQMTGKQSHAKFIAELRDGIVALVKKQGIQINECQLQVCVMDDLSKRLKEQVADDVILHK